MCRTPSLLKTIFRYSKEERGDLLIFASGFAEIMTLAEAITEYDTEQGK